MDYYRLDKIKNEIEFDNDLSLVALKEFKKIIEKKIRNWGTEPYKQYRIM